MRSIPLTYPEYTGDFQPRSFSKRLVTKHLCNRLVISPYIPASPRFVRNSKAWLFWRRSSHDSLWKESLCDWTWKTGDMRKCEGRWRITCTCLRFLSTMYIKTLLFTRRSCNENTCHTPVHCELTGLNGYVTNIEDSIIYLKGLTGGDHSIYWGILSEWVREQRLLWVIWYNLNKF